MKINNLILEELQHILSEGFIMEDDNFKFHQRFNNSTFYHYQSFSNDFDAEISESDIIINWRIGFKLDETGVETFFVQVGSVEGIYKVLLRDKQTDELAQEIDKEINEIPWRFDIENINLVLNSSLYINSLSFDFESKICLVIFQ